MSMEIRVEMILKRVRLTAGFARLFHHHSVDQPLGLAPRPMGRMHDELATPRRGQFIRSQGSTLLIPGNGYRLFSPLLVGANRR